MGTVGLLLKERGFDYTEVDFSDVAVARTQHKGLNAIVSDVDGDGLKFPDNSFDFVWAGDVLEHVFDPIGMLSEIHRVLKPGGSILLTSPNDFTLASRMRIFLTGQSVQSKTYRSLGQCKHHTAFSWELLTFMLDRTSLKITEYRSILVFPKVKREILSSNQKVGSWFGKVFIIKASKPSVSANV